VKVTCLLGHVGLLIALLLPSALLASSPAAVEFSADTRQSAPQQGERTGRIYVSKQRVRTEMRQAGQLVIRIVDANTGSAWVIYPLHKSYMERLGTRASTDESPKGNPCYGLINSNCTKLNEEPVAGRAAQKWRVSVAAAKGKQESIHWIDKERNILLRQTSSQGVMMEQKMLGTETLNGRTVEKWQMTQNRAGKKPQQSTRWFDLQLNLAIREEYPGGYVREMSNIEVGPQKAKLFSVPAGYKKLESKPVLPAKKR